MYLNKVTIIGNITKDIELKSLPSGQSVISFGVATNRNWKDKDGNKQEAVEYHNVVVFGKQADIIKQYCGKGDQIYIEGRLQTRKWEKDGQNHYSTEIVLENFQFGNKVKKELTEQDKVNIKSAEEVGQTLTDEELSSLEDIPF